MSQGVWFNDKSNCSSKSKGGVGKTTTAVNLSSCLAYKGKKVLLLDVDPQGNATSGLGVDKKNTKGSTYDVLINEESIEKFLLIHLLKI